MFGNKMRNVFIVLMIICLTFVSLPMNGRGVKALQPAQSISLTPSNVTGTWEDYVVYLRTNEAISGTFNNYAEFAMAGGTILVDGVENASVKLLTAWDANHIYIQNVGGNFEAGTVVTIFGQFSLGDDILIDIKKISLKWDGSSWNIYTTSSDLGEIAFTRVSSTAPSADGFYVISDKDPSLSAEDWSWGFVAADESSGAYYQGQKLKATIIWGGWVNHPYIQLGQSFVSGDYITLKGTFVSNNTSTCNEQFTLKEEYSYIYDGTAWTMYAPSTTSEVTLAVRAEKNNNGNTGSMLYMISEETPAAVTGYNYWYVAESGIITVNGTSIDSRLQQYDVGKWLFDLSNVYGELSTGDILFIGGSFTYNGNTIAINPVSFCYDGENSWSEYVELDASMTLSLSPYEISGIDDEGNYILYVQSSIGVPGNMNDIVYNGLTTTIDGSVVEVEMGKSDYGSLVVTIPKSALISNEFEFVIEDGILTDSEGVSLRELKADTTFCINELGVNLDKFLVNAGENVDFSYTDWDVSGNGFYLQASDNVPMTGWTGPTIDPLDDVENGFFVNGIKNEDIFMRKVNETSYYVYLQAANYVPTLGDVVIVNGIFKQNEYLVDVNTWAGIWNGKGWTVKDLSEPIILSECVMDITDNEWVLTTNAIVNKQVMMKGNVLYDSGIYKIESTLGDAKISQNIVLYRAGDVDSDGDYDIIDILRLKKQNATTTIGQYAILNGDIDVVRNRILGMTKTGDWLPTDMMGQTGTGTYLTSVQLSSAGTTVIGVADDDNNYTPNTETFNDYGLDYVLDFAIDRELKVLQLSDPQIMDCYEKEPAKVYEKVFWYIEKAVEEAKPDIIIMTGDLVYGQYDNDGISFAALIDFMESLKIPWAPVFGNHDNESTIGVSWQCEQLTNATYCLFNRRHNIGGNGNTSIGLAKNGELQRTMYMLDSNGCWDTTDNDVKRNTGFTDEQKKWYYTTAQRVNSLAGENIPSFLAYHIPTNEVLSAALAACYQQGEDSANISYEIGKDVVAQTGDSGRKGEVFKGIYEAEKLLHYMNEVGGDGAFFGHSHNNNTSVMFGKVRWTFGLKTGTYERYPAQLGGTLIILSKTNNAFTVEQVVVND